jgi:cysteine synthase A
MIATDFSQRLQGISSLICNTPLLEIAFLYRGQERVLFAKAEHLNMTGSIKDRMAFHVLKKAYTTGALHRGDTIVEVTSGNTGISFSAIGQAMGHPVNILMPEWMSEERKSLIRGFGARISLVTKEEGGFIGAIRLAEEIAAGREDIFLPRQFSNSDNIEAHYLTTGTEIWWQLRVHAVVPQAFVAGVGTGGTVMGIGQLLKEKYPGIRIHPLEPASSPTLSTGHRVGTHRIQGISDEFIPPIINFQNLDSIISVDDGDAILMAKKLASQLGLGVGISSGANFLGALIAQNALQADAPIVTVFPDDNKKYLSTDLFREEPERDGYLAPDIQLLGFRAHRRVCYTCCDTDGCLDTYSPGALAESLPDCPVRKMMNAEE